MREPCHVIVVLTALLLGTWQNDDREFAIKLANCRKVCASKYPDTPDCLDECSLLRACSLYSCPHFCGRDDGVCTDTCLSFTEDVTCGTPCQGDLVVEVGVWQGGVPSINVSVQLPDDTFSHVVLLEQLNTTTNTSLTFDTSKEVNTTFTGLYPWIQYSVEVAVMGGAGCCLYHHPWTGNTSYDIIAHQSEVEFYPYALSPQWVEQSLEGTTAPPSHLFPEEAEYMPDEPSYGIYNPPWFYYYFYQENLSQNQYSVQPGILGLKSWEECKGMECVKEYGMGYLVNVARKSHLNPIKVYTDDTDEELKIRSKNICRDFPNLEEAKNKTLQIKCATINTKNEMQIWLRNNDHLNHKIKYCLKSETAGGPLNQTCCTTGVSCVHNVINNTLTLNTTQNYLFYFTTQRADNKPCQNSHPCSGYYQRISPSTEDIPKCVTDRSPDHTIVIVMSVFSSLLFILILVGGVLFFLNRKAPEKTQEYIPTEEDALLGGPLPRDAISKEVYIDRGNFGHIFEGKLKVKLTGQSDLTKQYEVALKILKPKLDDNEGSENEQDNAKEAKKAMKAEINIMKGIQDGRPIHKNVLRMYGYVVEASPYILVLELCFTNLTRYLRQLRLQIDNRTLSPNDIEFSTSNTGLEKRTLSTLVSHSVEENSVSIVHINPIPARIRHGLTRNMSGYNDSVHGRMIKQVPSMERYKDTVLTTADLLDFCWQVSCGMDFLHSIDLIHRDLAADNVLIKENQDGSLALKICDFGQSRSLFHGNYVGSGDTIADRQRMVRLRWTAPEIKLDAKKWSKFSDVWSYGVFMWEVHTLGGKPYSEWPDHLVMEKLLQGERMQQPSCCIHSIWKITCRCWDESPENREHFSAIKQELEVIKKEERDKALGIEKSDYMMCDEPEDDALESRDLDGDELDPDVDIMDVDKNEGPLSWELINPPEELNAGSPENTFTDHQPPQAIIVDHQPSNGAVYQNAIAVLMMGTGESEAESENQKANLL